ncbi:MAG: ABC transporter substrate-binding protein [Dehalococcoidia bacterium]|nr:ABC transporter substrate-binding protein [Dehalococcoidia bacterium]
MPTEQDLDLSRTLFGRRTVLRGSLLAGAGLAAAALIGCGSDDDSGSGTPEASATGTSAASNIDQGDAERGKYVKDASLPYPYNFPEPKKEAKSGGIMKVAATWDVSDIDPTVSAAGGTVTVPNMIYNRLLGIQRGPKADPFNQPVLEPELAKSWERSPDGLTFTFKITPGIKWQNLAPLNGRPFVAADAAYALERYSKTGAHQQYYSNVSGFEVVDDLTFKIKMKRPVVDFLNPLGSNKQTIFPKELVDDGTINKRGIGTGPMILKELTTSQRVTFDKNPDYWERKVLLDGFEFRIMPDLAARLAAFRAGQIDYAYAVASTFGDVKNLLSQNANLQVNLLPVTAVRSLAFNCQNPKFTDVRVRRAISLAMNRDTMTQLIFEGFGKSLNVIPWTYIFDKEPTFATGNLGKWATYDPTQAKQLLAAAGQSSLTINNIFYPYTGAYEKTPEVLLPMLKDVGITMTGGKVDYTEFNSQWTGRKLPEFSTSGWLTTGFDADNYFYGQVHSKSTGNRSQFVDPDIDSWAEAQQVELSPDKRKEIWRKIWDKDLDQAYRPPFSDGFTPEVLQPWLRGIRWSGSAPGDNSSYYNWGDQVSYGWLDK